MADKKDSSDSDRAKKKLVYAVVLASIAALLLAVLQVLPAKFGIDLTGFGTYIGLTRIYEARQELEKVRNTIDQQRSETIDLPVGEELEYKIYILEGDRVEYQWRTDQGELLFQFHGEPQGIDGAILQSYSMSTASEDSGTLTAPFEGTHGWYWRNDNSFPVKITLEIQGKYNTLGIKAAAFSRKK